MWNNCDTFKIYNSFGAYDYYTLNYTLSYQLLTNNLIIQEVAIEFSKILQILTKIGPVLRNLGLFVCNYGAEEYVFIFGKYRYILSRGVVFEKISKILLSECRGIISAEVFHIKVTEDHWWEELIRKNENLNSFVLLNIKERKNLGNILESLPKNLEKVEIHFLFWKPLDFQPVFFLFIFVFFKLYKK